MKKLTGQITIGRTTAADNDEPIRIEITDKASGIRIVTLTMRLEDFASCVTGLGYQKCSVELTEDPTGKLGKHIKAKTELVPFKWSGKYEDEKGKRKAADKAVAPFLVDGWSEYRASDLFNHHTWSRGNDGLDYQAVVFWRYDETPEGAPQKGQKP